MKSSEFQIDDREALYGRLVSDVLVTLQHAVQHRVEQGATRAQIAERIGCARSQLSRVLNGHVPNLTVRTIADILWAAEFEPCEFSAEAIDTISPNRQCTLVHHQVMPIATSTASAPNQYRIYLSSRTSPVQDSFVYEAAL
jgi:transcriptional regulator with XRE-family HTH domain